MSETDLLKTKLESIVLDASDPQSRVLKLGRALSKILELDAPDRDEDDDLSYETYLMLEDGWYTCMSTVRKTLLEELSEGK